MTGQGRQSGQRAVACTEAWQRGLIRIPGNVIEDHQDYRSSNTSSQYHIPTWRRGPSSDQRSLDEPNCCARTIWTGHCISGRCMHTRPGRIARRHRAGPRDERRGQGPSSQSRHPREIPVSVMRESRWDDESFWRQRHEPLHLDHLGAQPGLGVQIPFGAHLSVGVSGQLLGHPLASGKQRVSWLCFVDDLVHRQARPDHEVDVSLGHAAVMQQAEELLRDNRNLRDGSRGGG